MLHLDPNTEATLLLCGRFVQDGAVAPLDQRDYNRLASWLEAHEMRPGDLLDVPDLDTPDLPIPAARLTALLARGAGLALAVEGWESKGLWVLGRDDELYPPRLRRLGAHTPPLIYGAGRQDLLWQDLPALAIVGSRDVDEPALEIVRRIARACAYSGATVVSGGARGVDSEAMGAAVDAEGVAIGVLADSLARAAVSGRYRGALMQGSLVLLSPYDPAAGFNVGNAMGRNKHVYALGNAALVVWTAYGSGGTWAGAVEALKRRYTPVYVWLEGDVPEGNHRLLDEGAEPFPPEPWPHLAAWLPEISTPPETDGGGEFKPTQGTLWL
jgi:predicted Rossmann fold nucleotide-binding protein DprA/Smf involved in DNA uptake